MQNDIIKAIIIDDESGAISNMYALLNDLNEIAVVGHAENVDQGLAIILEKQVDLVFLDINMPIKNGFELLHELSKYKLSPAVIFTTAYEEYAIEAIRHNAFDYLLKPVDPLELKKVIRRYQCHCSKKEELSGDGQGVRQPAGAKLRFPTRSGHYFVHPDEIVYVKAEGNYSELFLSGGTSIIISAYLKDISEQLPDPCFPRLGRSTIINIRYLKQIDRVKSLCILECNHKSYPISISRKTMKTLEGHL